MDTKVHDKMTDRINITWVLPFIGPFVVLGIARAVWWAAGAQWVYPDMAAFCSLFSGVAIGAMFASDFSRDRTPLTIRKWWINRIKKDALK